MFVAVEKVFIKWQAFLCMLMVATSSFKKKKQTKKSVCCSNQGWWREGPHGVLRPTCFLILCTLTVGQLSSMSVENFLIKSSNTGLTLKKTRSPPHVAHLRQPRPHLLWENPTVSFTTEVKGFVICRHLPKYDLCIFTATLDKVSTAAGNCNFKIKLTMWHPKEQQTEEQGIFFFFRLQHGYVCWHFVAQTQNNDFNSNSCLSVAVILPAIVSARACRPYR